MNILLGVTGSVAAVLTPKLVSSFTELGHNVIVVMTSSARKFLCEPQMISFTHYADKDEWDSFKEIGDPILHIELRKWADVLLVAPCTMNTLGKIANGLCDNLLTNIVRAWDGSKRFFIAPAANTHMWSHPITQQQIIVLQEELGVNVIMPVEKTLACGDTGVGAMADVKTIVERVTCK